MVIRKKDKTKRTNKYLQRLQETKDEAIKTKDEFGYYIPPQLRWRGDNYVCFMFIVLMTSLFKIPQVERLFQIISYLLKRGKTNFFCMILLLIYILYHTINKKKEREKSFLFCLYDSAINIHLFMLGN
jgi:hypothetical protein